MKYLKLFENYQESDTLYIFDFDDTLVDSPSFEELAIEYLTENITIGDLIKRSLRFTNKDMSDLRIENGRIYIEDPNQMIEDVYEAANVIREADHYHQQMLDILHSNNAN